MHEPASLLRDLAVVLTIAAILTLLMQRLRLPVHVGYLLAGLLMGPGLPMSLVGSEERIQALSELGVILLLFSIGLEFSIRKLTHQGPRIVIATLVETVALFAIGLFSARLLGWSLTEGVFLGAAIAVASTMMLARSLAEHPPERQLRDLTLGINVVEDLIAMFMIAALGALVAGRQVTGALLGETLFWLLVFVVTVVGVGLLVVPNLIRAVVRLERMELLLVTTLGLCFLLAWLAGAAGHSVALGAFLAGFLVNESGSGREIREIIRPLRYLFGALFFISVGMLAPPAAMLEAWPVILLLTLIVIVGNTAFVALGAFLAGYGIHTSVRAGFYMSQIGEFGFIIAGMAMLAGYPQIFPVVVGTSIATATLGNVLVGRSEAMALWIDRRLPRAWQTYASLYSSWIDSLARRPRREDRRRPIRRLAGLAALDAAALATVVAVTAVIQRRAVELLGDRFTLGPVTARAVILAIGVTLAVPLLYGLFLTARRIAIRLAERAMPPAPPGRVDQARSPRRVLQATLMLLASLAALVPVALVTSPFVPAYLGPFAVGVVLLVLLVSLRQATSDLAGHAQAGAELVAHVLAKQGMAQDTGLYQKVEALLPGLGNLMPVQIDAASAAAGRTLGELNLRGRTGATVVGISRDGREIVHPAAAERLQAGDLVALSGSRDAVQAARRQLEARSAS